MHTRGEIKPGETFIHTSITGTKFIGRIASETKIADRDAVVPAISGQAWITSFGQYSIDPTDPYQEGQTLSDVWF
jgi:proline racemase